MDAGCEVRLGASDPRATAHRMIKNDVGELVAAAEAPYLRRRSGSLERNWLRYWNARAG